MPYLTNTEDNELKRLKTTTDEGVLGDEELWAVKARELWRREIDRIQIQIREIHKL
jgi:hypothetical protein